MKNFYKLLLIVLFIFGTTSIQAQDENNPWQISFGTHAVDQDADTSTQIPDFFSVDEDWNLSSPFSMFSVSRYLDSGLSFGVGASINSITKYPEAFHQDRASLYYTVDAMLKYSLGDVFDWGDWEPFVGIGPGWTWQEDANWMTGNLTVGMNYWLNDKWGLTFQSDYKHNMDDAVQVNNMDLNQYLDEGGSMRWSVGVSVKFGGTDTDGDGIYDDHDDCPTIPGLEEFNGCPDTDGDGIQDSEDDCPLQAGSAEHNGCPDTDGDGIQDSEDDCPMVAGLAEYNGCPDTDGDGIPDNKDKCPKEAGKASMDGCPDSDGDGIADVRDNCPNVAGPRGNRGCPWPDRDGDSVVDKDDECPDTAGTVANNGCPEGPSEDDMARITEMSRGIQFAFGSAIFTEGTPPVLDAIVEIILKYPKSSFSVEGHTDSIGTKGYNQGLSERRANAVTSYLSSRNISSSRLSASGLGETMPIDTNINEAGRSKNRRVEIIFVK